MHRPQHVGQQVIDHPTQQVLETVTEDLTCVVADEHNLAGAGDDQRGIRGGIRQRPRDMVAKRLEQA